MLTNLSEYSEMTCFPAQGSNSVGQSSVLIKRRSRVQVPPALPFLFILLTGCVLYLEPSSSPSVYDEVWLEQPYVQCYHDAYWNTSEWYVEIYADSYYGDYEVVEVGYYTNGYDYTWMQYGGNGLWFSSFYSSYYNCYDVMYFDFVATCYAGYEGFYTFYW